MYKLIGIGELDSHRISSIGAVGDELSSVTTGKVVLELEAVPTVRNEQ